MSLKGSRGCPGEAGPFPGSLNLAVALMRKREPQRETGEDENLHLDLDRDRREQKKNEEKETATDLDPSELNTLANTDDPLEGKGPNDLLQVSLEAQLDLDVEFLVVLGLKNHDSGDALVGNGGVELDALQFGLPDVVVDGVDLDVGGKGEVLGLVGGIDQREGLVLSPSCPHGNSRKGDVNEWINKGRKDESLRPLNQEWQQENE